MKYLPSKLTTLLLILVVGMIASSTAFGTATIVIQNNDAPGVGFNDPTPATPVGNNPGTTVGDQRLRAFEFAASIWGARGTLRKEASKKNKPILVYEGGESMRFDYLSINEYLKV